MIHLLNVIIRDVTSIKINSADVLSDHRFLVRVSYLEIYNEEVRDLLGKDQMQRLEVRKQHISAYLKA